MSRVFRGLFFLTVSLLMLSGLFGSVFGATESEAVVVMDGAESDIVLCYSAVVKADEAGANVSMLLNRLFEAGAFLSLAEWSLENGDFDSALTYAGQSQTVLSGFVGEAEELTEYAFNSHYWSFMTDVLILVVGTSVIVVGSIVIWLLLKRRSVAVLTSGLG